MKLDITIMWTIYLRGADTPSLDAQEALCRQAAAELGYTTDPAHIWRDDASGADMDRPVLQEMLNEAEAGAINALVAPSWDRLSRDARDLVTILARLDRAGVQVHVADCLPEDLTKEVNLEETDAIRKISEMAAEGMTSGEIARKLKQEGILTYTRGKWRGSHVSRILDTIAMPVIEQALFKEVQGKLEASRRESEHRNSPHLLSGLVRCGRSGRPMWRMKTRKGVHYYRCNATSSSCEAGLLNADPVERAVLDAVSEIVPSAKNLDPLDREGWRAAIAALGVRVTVEAAADMLQVTIETDPGTVTT